MEPPHGAHAQAGPQLQGSAKEGLPFDRNVVSVQEIAEEATPYRVHQRVLPDRQRAIYGTNPHGPKSTYRVHADSRLRHRIQHRTFEDDGTVFESSKSRTRTL